MTVSRVAYQSFPKRCRWCKKKHGRTDSEWCSDECKTKDMRPAIEKELDKER